MIKKHKFFNLIKKHKFARFLLVGVLNTLFSYFLYGSLILIGLNYKYAVLLATIIGVLFNFQTTGRTRFWVELIHDKYHKS
ncbi:MAG UNVERIFIED_CONTAM: GtrA family protein [Microcystis novacekii LVE1205-3]|jgi:putative flippase GtrA